MFKDSSEVAGASSLNSNMKHGWLRMCSAVPELVRRAAKQRSRANARGAMSFETLESRTLLSADNIAPTATLNGPSSVDENQAATFTFSDPVDDSGDLSAGLRYSLDFTNDGVFDIVDSSSPDLIIPAYSLNGPSTVNVRARVADIDGGFTDYTLPLAVTNSAPTLSATVLAPVYEGGWARIGFSNIIDSPGDLAARLRFTVVDPAGAISILPYWNSTTVNGVTTIDAGITVTAANIAHGPATTSFTIRATDQNGAFTDIVVPVQVLGIFDGMTFTGPTSLAENQSGTFTVNLRADVPDEVRTWMLYSFDLNNDGVFEVSPGSLPWVRAGPYLANGPSVKTIRAKASYNGGKSSVLTRDVSITNAAPSATIEYQTIVDEGRSVTISATNVVDTYVDLVAGLRYSLDLNQDGTWEYQDVTMSSFLITAAELGAGPSTRVFTVRITDSEGASSDYSGSIQIRNVAPSAGTLSIDRVQTQTGDNITLKLLGANDPGQALNRLEFYRDDGDGVLNLALDTLIYSRDGAVTGSEQVQVSTTGWRPTGTLKLFARVLDQAGLAGSSNSASIYVGPVLIGSLDASPLIVNSGATLTITAQGVQTLPGATISRVEFYRDTNYNGLFDPLVDVLIAADTSATGGWSIAKSTANWLIGNTTIMARAQDSLGRWSHVSRTSVIVNALPVVKKVAFPTAVTPGATLEGYSIVTDADGSIARVDYYRDVDGNGRLSTSIDELMPGGAAIVAPTAIGTYRYLVRGQDDRGAWSAAKGFSIAVTQAPRIDGPFIASPDPVSRGSMLTLSVDNVSDDESVASVSFYRDVDRDGRISVGDKFLGTDTTASDGFQLAINSSSTGFVSGENRLIAFAKDNKGVTSLPKLTSVIIDAPPTLSSFTASSSPRASLPITLAAKGSTVITNLAFYLDTGDGLFSSTTDTLLGYGTYDSVAKSWKLILPANVLPVGSIKLFARAGDGVGFSTARSLTIAVGA